MTRHHVAKEDGICLLSVSKEATLNELWIKPCVPYKKVKRTIKFFRPVLGAIFSLLLDPYWVFILPNYGSFVESLFSHICVFFLTGSYRPLCGLSSSSCEGFWPSAYGFFFGLWTKRRSVYAVFAYFWCSIVTAVTFICNHCHFFFSMQKKSKKNLRKSPTFKDFKKYKKNTKKSYKIRCKIN